MTARYWIGGAALLAAGFLASCQTMTKDECVAADWQVIGEQDGAEGYDPQDRFGRHVKACERANVIPDQTAWFEGYQRGLVRYCTPLKGLSSGQAGRAYANVCPAETEAGFLRGYRLGRADYDKRSEIRQSENNISRAEAEIDRVERLLEEGKVEEGEGRRLIRQQDRIIRDNEREIDRKRFDLARIERDIEWFERNPDADLPFSY